MHFNSTNQKWVHIALSSPVWILIIMTFSEKFVSTFVSFVLFIFSFFYCFLFLFGFSFLLFLPVSGQFPPKKIALPPVGVKVCVSFRVKFRIWVKFSSGAIVLEPFLSVEKKEIFCMPTKC